MAGPWRGGLAVRRMQKGQVPVADLLCSACLHHRRVTGRAMVRDFLNAKPIETHRDQCPAKTNP
jgi:hypothetical protein